MDGPFRLLHGRCAARTRRRSSRRSRAARRPHAPRPRRATSPRRSRRRSSPSWTRTGTSTSARARCPPCRTRAPRRGTRGTRRGRRGGRPTTWRTRACCTCWCAFGNFFRARPMRPGPALHAASVGRMLQAEYSAQPAKASRRRGALTSRPAPRPQGHVQRTRTRVLRNTERLRKREDGAGNPLAPADDATVQDQGFTRPKARHRPQTILSSPPSVSPLEPCKPPHAAPQAAQADCSAPPPPCPARRRSSSSPPAASPTAGCRACSTSSRRRRAAPTP